MISIERAKVILDEVKLENHRLQFKEQHVFICPKLFSDSLHPIISNKLNSSPYIQKIDKKEDGSIISQEYSISSEAIITQIINFYLNQNAVIEAVKKISNNPKIKSFKGRVYKFEADEFSFDNWHDDRTDNSRLLGLSINLSEAPYDGGEFQIRNKENKQVYTKVKHQHWGSAHFFRIHPMLEHVVTK